MGNSPIGSQNFTEVTPNHFKRIYDSVQPIDTTSYSTSSEVSLSVIALTDIHVHVHVQVTVTEP